MGTASMISWWRSLATSCWPKRIRLPGFWSRPQYGNFPAEVDIYSLDGTDGYRIKGIELRDRTGLASGGAGDINGDGRVDLIVGAIFASPSVDRFRAGQNYVLFGGQLGALDASDGAFRWG